MNEPIDSDAEDILLLCAEKVTLDGKSDSLIANMILCSAASHNRKQPSHILLDLIRAMKADMYRFYNVVPLLNGSSVEYMAFCGREIVRHDA